MKKIGERVTYRFCEVLFWGCLATLLMLGIKSAWAADDTAREVCAIMAFCAIGVVASAGQTAAMDEEQEDE